MDGPTKEPPASPPQKPYGATTPPHSSPAQAASTPSKPPAPPLAVTSFAAGSLDTESLSPSSSTGSLHHESLSLGLTPELANHPSMRGHHQHYAVTPDAKSSALKALAGIGRVVSRSRQVDAEALQAIKAQRARMKAEGGTTPSGVASPAAAPRHRHSRTLSTESLAQFPELSSLLQHAQQQPAQASGSMSLPPPPPLASSQQQRGTPATAHRRSLSGVPPPRTSPQHYADLFAGVELVELLAMHAALENEIRRQLTATGMVGGNAAAQVLSGQTLSMHQQQQQHPTSTAADAYISSQYASALVPSQQQQQQQQPSQSPPQLFTSHQHDFQGLGERFSSASLPPRSQFGSGGGGGPNSLSPHRPRRPSHLRSASFDASAPLPSQQAQHELSTSSLGGSNISFNSVSIESLNLDYVVSPRALGMDGGSAMGSSADHLGLSCSDREFSFLSDLRDVPLGCQISTSSLLAPQSAPVASPFARAAASLPPRPERMKAAATAIHSFGSSSSEAAELPALFSNLQLGGLDTWR